MAGFTIPISTFEVEAARGNVTGVAQFEKYGRLINVDTTDSFPKDIWNGDAVYSGFPTGAAETMEVFSSDANDTILGTGARTVTIGNLQDGDGNMMPDITVDLDGVTPVSLGAQTYSRATRMRCHDVGSGLNNAGELTLRHTTTTANIFAVMPAGYNSTHIMAYTVPVGKGLCVHGSLISLARASGAAGSAHCTIRARLYGETSFITYRSVDITQANPYRSVAGSGYMTFPARTDIKISIEDVSDNDTIIAAELSGYMSDV